MPIKIIRLVFTSLRIVILMLVIFLVVFFFFTFVIEFEERDIDRASIEIKDSIVHNLTIQLGVFNKFDLQELNDRDIEPIRHCRYPYKATIENLETNEKWSFGHDPGRLNTITSTRRETNVGIAEPILSAGDIDENVIRPGRMTIDVYDTWLGITTCMIETAYKQKIVVEERFTCPEYIEKTYGVCGFPVRSKNNDPDSNYVCLFTIDENSVRHDLEECRYLPGIYVLENHRMFPGDEKKLIKAVPLNRVFPQVRGLPFISCDSIMPYLVRENEDVRSVVICFDDIVDD